MRTLFASLVLIGACTVPDKQPDTHDGGMDANTDPGAIPNTTITSAPSEFSNAGAATFEFESDVPDSRFMCSVNGEPAAACTSPFVRSLADGAHNFLVRAINSEGEGDDTPAEHLWSIDTVAPITTLTEAPAAADNSTMVRFSFMANEMFIAFECSLDGGPFETCRTGDMFGPVNDGAHSFGVRAKDRAGNVDASPAVHAWQVDTSTPDTTLLSGPSGSVASASATFEFLSPDAGAGATFECSLDGSAFAGCTSPATYSGLAMGVHTFSVRVRDANGNYDPTPSVRTWTADQTPPETMVTSAPSGTVAMASASISFTSNELTATYACSLDGGAFAACTSPFNATNLAQGAHSFSVIATDEAGNADLSAATASWTVDTTTPEVTFSSGPSTNDVTGPYARFTFAANEGTVTCRVDGGEWLPCSSVFGFNHAAGAASFEVRAVDGAGNETIVPRTFTVDCAAPDVTDAAGLLHFEDNTQVLANATGGAGATLGPTADAEAADPAFVTGRFGAGLSFTAAEGDLVSWPAALGSISTFSLELWTLPAGLAGTRDIVVSGDGRFSLRVTLEGAGSVRFSATAVDTSGVMNTVSSGLYPAGAWHMLAVTLAGTGLQLYVDADPYQVAFNRSAIAFDSLQLGGTLGGTLDEVWIATQAYASSLARYCPVSGVRVNPAP